MTREGENETVLEVQGRFGASEAERLHDPSRVLVVGHDTDFRDMLSELLAAEGYEVREAANLGAAIRHVTDRRPAVVLLDLMMSSAPAILRWLCHHPRAAGVPVVVISQAALPPDGASAVVREPIERGPLAAILKSVRANDFDASSPAPEPKRVAG